MLGHFEKLKTPLKSVFTYPDLQAQQARFASRGWSHVDVSSLWKIWSSDQWLSADERKRIDAIEPFDEWEEFALFAAHYCVVIARTYYGSPRMVPISSKAQEKLGVPVLIPDADVREYSGTRGQRRFGAAMRLRNHLGEEFLANTFGHGTNTRLRSYDLYAKESPLGDIKTNHAGPNGRMCHTITDLGDHGSLLVGGRTSPSSALRDCWLFKKGTNEWQRAEDLPLPLYRHGITRLGGSSLALLIGGKSDSSTIFDGCLLYQPSSGWIECEISETKYIPAFGSLLISHQETYHSVANDGVQFYGVLAGGILQHGTIARQILRWILTLPKNGKPTISFTTLPERIDSSAEVMDTTNNHDELISRFGASGFVSHEGYLSVIGGIVADGIVMRDLDILVIDISGTSYEIISACRIAVPPRPLLIGVSTELVDGQLVVMGGGATCFSMGTYWNSVCYTLGYNPNSPVHGSATTSSNDRKWTFSRVVEVTEATESQSGSIAPCNGQGALTVDIPRLQISTADAFLAVLKAGKPVIIESGDLGNCIKTWSSDHIVQQLGFDREVTIPP